MTAMQTTRLLIVLVSLMHFTSLSASAQWSLNGVKVFYNAGNVGIGTNNPAHTLEVRSAGTRAVFAYSDAASGFNHAVYGQTDSPDGRALYGLANTSTGTNFAIVGKTNSPTGYAGWFVGGRNYFEGKVGIGVINPQAKLDVNGNIYFNGGLLSRNEPAQYNVKRAGSQLEVNGRTITFKTEGIERMQVRNTANGGLIFASSNLSVPVLTIRGGADLAEPFTVSDCDPTEKPQPGMVMVIDPDRAGELKIAREPYDRKVAGVISGANGLSPGMVMRAAGNPLADGEHPVALTGRVWCWCDASAASIQPGDLLTTSATPGHAMKAIDSSRAHGAVIGKAMTNLGDGRGLVLVLVNLQ